MKKTILAALSLCTAFCLFAGPVSAADVKIGIIDTQKIVSNSKAGKSAQAVFSKELEANNTTYSAKGKELQTLQEELSAKASTMTASEYSEKTAKYSKLQKELERMKNDIEEDLNNRQTELNRKLYTEITAIVADYCKKENFTFILEKSYVAAYSEAVDITEKIIELYDATK